MQLFYCPDIMPAGYCTLDTEESRHSVRVMRLREGDSINVTDGRGNLYSCTIVDANDHACVIEVVEQDFSIFNSQFTWPSLPPRTRRVWSGWWRRLWR